ncbi:MAG: sulfur carrier protein ThiS [Deltaproteobacteria bacterium]|nr:sulfur carrier protein ThiS [Deltaproteobacteria bacterium]
MKLTINGKDEEISGLESITVIDLLTRREINPEMVSVEINDSILKKDEFTTSLLKEGDRVEFLYFMGGGI